MRPDYDESHPGGALPAVAALFTVACAVIALTVLGVALFMLGHS